MSDAKRLRTIRARLAAIRPGDWSIAADRDGPFVETRGPKGELWPLARFDLGASADEMQFFANAPATVEYLLGLVDRAIEKLRQAPDVEGASPDCQSGQDGQSGQDAAGNFAAQCAITCAAPAFRVYLEASHGLERPLTPERVAQKVRSIVGVTSRRELNHDAAAAARWKDLLRAYEAWRKVSA